MKRLPILLLAFVQSHLFAQELKLKPLQEFEMEVSTDLAGPGTKQELCNFQFQVLSKDSSNTYRLKCSLVRIRSKMGNYGDVNSEKVRSTKLNSTYPLLSLALLHKPFVIVISNKGELKAIEGLDDIVKQAVIHWQLPPAREQEMLGNAKGFPQAMLNGLFLQGIPSNISLNSEWTKKDNSVTYKVTAIRGALTDIRYETAPEKKATGDLKGTLILNTVTGLVEFDESVNKYSTENYQTKEKVQATESWKRMLINSPKRYANDSAWVNMAVQMSFWSEAFKEGGEYDLKKAKSFFKRYETQFGSDAYFAQNKLDLIQRGKDNYDEYSRQLVKTPNHFIAEAPHHLHNKMGNVLEIHADSAYALAKYLIKTPDFYSWVQHSYSQSFLHPDSDNDRWTELRQRLTTDGYSKEKIDSLVSKYKASEKNSYILLEKLNSDKDPKFQSSIKPLYFWVKAKQTKDPKSIIKLAQSFKKFDNTYWMEGNAGRYQLLVSQVLNKAGEQEKAGLLLEDAIQKLEKLSADTLNKNRMAHQNLLAGAYYIKYLEDNKKNPQNAMLSLSKAAEHSPKDAKEMAHDSFYDRVFLNTKEGYRKEFVEKLFDSGDKEQALKVFALHISSSPDELGEMKKLYQKHFPDKGFSTFLAESVISSWNEAPDFSLKGLKGEAYSLKDFKNKWLVLDFWGTWCGPCRKEMPDLNKFNLALKDGKHPDVSFLSIACSDNQTNVENYFKANNFIIPAVMSDNIVERNYKVTGYPSKYIISPDGKMLNIKFGKDWQAILNSFISNYDKN